MNKNAKRSIFIVDDDADDRESIRDAFLEGKHDEEYIFMQSGEQLMGHFSSETAVPKPSLILLDLNMPGKHGKEVLKEIKTNEQLKLIPVIVITTSSSDMDRTMSYKLGANCFITKPDSYRELVVLTDCIARLWL